MKLAIAIFGSCLMCGCSIPTTGAVPVRDGMMTVTRQGNGFWVTTDSLRANALKEADAVCIGKGKVFKLIHTKEIQAGALGRWPESEVLFKCE